jgi:hypothetical protein
LYYRCLKVLLTWLTFQPQPEVLQSFKSFIVCATNYGGQAREDIETMVVQLGGTYTKQMTPENTHVICAKYVLTWKSLL